jgi:hypothetical protein
MGVLTRVLTVRSVTLVAFETMLIVVSIAAAAMVRFGERAPAFVFDADNLLKFVIVAVVLQGCLYYADLYDVRTLGDRRETFVRLVQALAAASFLLAGLYYALPALIISAAASSSLPLSFSSS